MIGDVVVIPFPHADLSGFKRRPAVVVAHGDRGDIVLCQVTSRSYSSATSIELDELSFQSGGLPLASFVRPAKLFTGNESLVIRTAGTLQRDVRDELLASVRELFAS